MKKSILTLIICLLSFFAFAQVPQGISYQGIAYNSSGNIVTNPVALRITILDYSGTGTPVYSESHIDIDPDDHGVFNLNIGMGTVLTPFTATSFSNIRWGVNTKFLKVEIDIASGTGTSYVLVGTSQLMSVPYALYSANSNVNTSIVNLTNIDTMRYFDKFKLLSAPPLTLSHMTMLQYLFKDIISQVMEVVEHSSLRDIQKWELQPIQFMTVVPLSIPIIVLLQMKESG